MATFQTPERPRDKLDLQFVFQHRHCLLAGLWNSQWVDVCDYLELHSIGSGLRNVVCQAEVGQMREAFAGRKVD